MHPETRILLKSDPILQQVVERFGTPPRFERPPGFLTLIQIILEQQISISSAQATFRRLDRAFPQGITAESVHRTNPEELQKLGITRQKANYLHKLATHLHKETFSLKGLANLSDEMACRELMKQKGIGIWTASVYLFSALKRTDIWLNNDLALRIAATELYQLDERIPGESVEVFAERWRPHRSEAVRILWHYYLETRRQKPPVTNKYK